MGRLLKEIREKQLGEEILSREEALLFAQNRLAERGS